MTYYYDYYVTKESVAQLDRGGPGASTSAAPAGWVKMPITSADVLTVMLPGNAVEIQSPEKGAQTPILSDCSLAIAEKQVNDFHKGLMSQHAEAMECRDCEDLVGRALDAYISVRQADETSRRAAQEGFLVGEEFASTVAGLYRQWLRSCTDVGPLVAAQLERGFTVARSDEFAAARHFVGQQLQLLEMHETLGSALDGGVFDDAFWMAAHNMRSS